MGYFVKNKVPTLVVMAALQSVRVVASNPETCSAEDFTGRGKFEAHMRTERPGDPLYAPKPFPKNNAAVIEDFLQQVQVLLRGPKPPIIEGGRRALAQAIELIERGRRALAQAIDQGTLHIGIVRVSNWKNFRCMNYRSGETIYLLRLYDTTTATEVARATMEESGLIDGVMYPTDRSNPVWSRPLPTLPQAETILTAAVGPVLDLQYAASYGTIQCDEWMPCVVGKLAGRDGYAFLSRSGIYEFEAESRHVDRRFSARNQVLPALKPNERVTSLGATYDVVVTKVADRP
jgi:hypothetical protein